MTEPTASRTPEIPGDDFPQYCGRTDSMGVECEKPELEKRITVLEGTLRERTKNADFLRSMVGACHLMISRNDIGELQRQEWEVITLPPRLLKFIAAITADRDAWKIRHDAKEQMRLEDEATIARLSAPVSTAEWNDNFDDEHYRRSFDAIIAGRKARP